MTGLQSRSRLQHEISGTTITQDGLPDHVAAARRRTMLANPGSHADERDDLVRRWG
jgi:hypothetical protein